MIYYLVCAIVGYLIGSIPFGYIIVKLVKGIDVRTVGSGNIGATNVARFLGMPWGILCFILDVAKGFVPTFYILSNLTFSPQVMYKIPPRHPDIDFSSVYFPVTESAIAIGLGLILGHLFPVYIRFRGGKGVATALGVFLAITQFLPVIPIVLLIWLIFFLLLRYVSFASIMAAIALPIVFWWQSQYNFPCMWEMHFTIPVMGICIVASILVIIKHIPNIKRLIKGTEPRVNLWGKSDKV
jgi:glycerol-3-phosphate acyltransferase PlsY